MNKKTKKLLGIITLIFIWFIISVFVNNKILVPTPIEVAKRIGSLLTIKETYIAILFSLSRIVIGFLIGVILGVILSFLSFYNSFLSYIISPIIWIFKTIPVAALVVVLYICIDSSFLPIVVSSIVIIPIIYQNIITGLDCKDNNLLKLNYVYNIKFVKKIKMIIIPQILPYLLSAILLSSSIAVKSAVAAEIISIPKMSLGAELYYFKISLDQTSILAICTILIFISVFLKMLIDFLLKRVIKNA